VLLIVRRTRRLAVLLSWALHAGISLSLPVYSFGFQMAFLVFTFWPEPSAVQVETRARGVA
jgi:hypothetical protein